MPKRPLTISCLTLVLAVGLSGCAMGFERFKEGIVTGVDNHGEKLLMSRLEADLHANSRTGKVHVYFAQLSAKLSDDYKAGVRRPFAATYGRLALKGEELRRLDRDDEERPSGTSERDLPSWIKSQALPPHVEAVPVVPREELVAPDLKTNRLRITALQHSDAAALFGYSSEERVARFQSWVPKSAGDATALIERSAAIPFNQNETWFRLAVRSARTGELLGDLGVHFVGDDGQQVEIGFAMSPAHQRQGFAKEAMRAVLDHLFSVLNKHRVFASVDPSNEASLALLRSLGMRQEAHFRQSLFWKGAWVDDVVFGILRSEWLARTDSM